MLCLSTRCCNISCPLSTPCSTSLDFSPLLQREGGERVAGQPPASSLSSRGKEERGLATYRSGFLIANVKKYLLSISSEFRILGFGFPFLRYRTNSCSNLFLCACCRLQASPLLLPSLPEGRRRESGRKHFRANLRSEWEVNWIFKSYRVGVT